MSTLHFSFMVSKKSKAFKKNVPLSPSFHSCIHFLCNVISPVHKPMTKTWYMNKIDEDQRLLHQCKLKLYIFLMEKLTYLGVLYWHLDTDKYETNSGMQKSIRIEAWFSAIANCHLVKKTATRYPRAIIHVSFHGSCNTFLSQPSLRVVPN
jgi:hypothetical protein